MLGYLNHQPSLDPITEAGWQRSGDMAMMDEAGYISIVGRVSEMIIRGGENLSPSEIESFLIQHDDIAEAAVIGLPDEKYGEELCAVLLANKPNHAGADEIRLWCSENLSRWKVPKYIAFVDTFPKTTSGKIQKFMLKESMLSEFGLATGQ
jgi:fatty-acyl-CoA synthase